MNSEIPPSSDDSGVTSDTSGLPSFPPFGAGDPAAVGAGTVVAGSTPPSQWPTPSQVGVYGATPPPLGGTPPPSGGPSIASGFAPTAPLPGPQQSTALPAPPSTPGGVPPTVTPARPGTSAAGTGPQPAPSGGRAGRLLTTALVAAVVGGLVAWGVTALAPESERVVTETASPNVTLAPGEALDIQSLLAKVRPSVVSIETGIRQFGATAGGAGSGVVLSEDGLILTNAHVVANANEIEVSFSDGETHSATVLGALTDADVAVLQAEGVEGAIPAEIGSSADLRVGDDVVAVGNALNLGAEPSVTVGIVSAKDRQIAAENVTLDGLIQTDAAINPGNSGGPLLNAAGQVVGINTAIIQDSQNIGFALAIDGVMELVDGIRSGDAPTASRGARLGVAVVNPGEVRTEVLERFGIAEGDEGAFVSDVTPDSGASDAGLQPGDLITGIDDTEITGKDDVGEVIRTHAVGDTVTVTFRRNGDETSVEATLTAG